jgi:hypothetical protein
MRRWYWALALLVLAVTVWGVVVADWKRTTENSFHVATAATTTLAAVLDRRQRGRAPA